MTMTERMRISNGGFVGIGNTNPGAALEVDASGTNYTSGIFFTPYDQQGNSAFRRIILKAENNRPTIQGQYLATTWQASDLLVNPDGGNVGVLTNAPAATFDVNGPSLRVGGGTPNLTSQGAIISWNNFSGAGGETDFINLRGGGAGGFAFYNVSSGASSVGTPLVLINASGNVGIGTTAPVGTLTVGSAAQAITLNYSDPSTGAWIRNDGTNMVISTNIGNMFYGYSGVSKYLYFYPGGTGTPAMTINTSGLVGIGTQTVNYQLSLYSSTNTYLDINAPLASQSSIQFSDSTNGQDWVVYRYQGSRDFTIWNKTVGTVMYLLQSNGYVGIFNASPAYPLDVSGDIRTSTCLHYASSTLGTCSSDERIKRNITPFAMGLDAVSGLKPVTYEYNGLAGNPDDGKRMVGLIAQDVEKVAPQLVGTKRVKLHPGDKTDTTIDTVDYGSLTYMLINAVKELRSLVDADHDQIAALQAGSRSPSDARLKKDIEPIAYGLDTVLKLRPVGFNWNPDLVQPGQNPAWKKQHQLGLIAQEVEPVVPEVVSTADDKMKTKSLAYSELVPILIKAVQDEQAEIDQLKAQLAAVKAAQQTPAAPAQHP